MCRDRKETGDTNVYTDASVVTVTDLKAQVREVLTPASTGRKGSRGFSTGSWRMKGVSRVGEEGSIAGLLRQENSIYKGTENS